jgi:FkbM family methyltransferase
LPVKTRLKRWLVDWASQDARVRRMALNRIFSNYAAEGVLCLVPFADHRVFVDPRDDRIAFSILSGRGWQRRQLEAALAKADTAGRLKRNGVFVDVGANIGLMTIYALLSGYFSAAVAIEPDPWNREILNRNIELNGMAQRVTVIGKAVSDATGHMQLHRDAKNLGAHSLEDGFVMSAEGGDRVVEVGRLDEILAISGLVPQDIGFVKVDVEGHEFAALGGMPELLAARPPLMIEVTFDGDGDGDGAADTERLTHLLEGYSLVAEIGDEMREAVALEKFKATGMQHELLFFGSSCRIGTV